MKAVTSGFVTQNGKWFSTEDEAGHDELQTELFEVAHSGAGLSPARVVNYVLENFTLIRKPK
jgi:hypothetical protein